MPKGKKKNIITIKLEMPIVRSCNMRIIPLELIIRDVVSGYIDDAEEGVSGYDGRLNIRPAYQREFIYQDKQRDEVIRTIKKGLPLNVMY